MVLQGRCERGQKSYLNKKQIFIRKKRSSCDTDSSMDEIDWVTQLRSDGALRSRAERELHALLVRVCRSRITHLSGADRLGAARIDELSHTSANEAMLAIVSKLDTFEGRSRFTTWAYKFALFHASTTLRKEVWKHREVDLDSAPEPFNLEADPSDSVEHSALREAIEAGIRSALTPRQQRVLLSITVEDVPIDVVAERLGSTRNAVYKTLHDARKRLRRHLEDAGMLAPAESRR